MSEADLQRSIKKALETAGEWVIRRGVNMKRGKGSTQAGEPGEPDLHLPELGWIEVKLPGNELSPSQVAWHARARLRGLNVGVAHTLHEGLLLASTWRVAKTNESRFKVRPKYLRTIK